MSKIQKEFEDVYRNIGYDLAWSNFRQRYLSEDTQAVWELWSRTYEQSA